MIAYRLEGRDNNDNLISCINIYLRDNIIRNERERERERVTFHRWNTYVAVAQSAAVQLFVEITWKHTVDRPQCCFRELRTGARNARWKYFVTLLATVTTLTLSRRYYQFSWSIN